MDVRCLSCALRAFGSISVARSYHLFCFDRCRALGHPRRRHRATTLSVPNTVPDWGEGVGSARSQMFHRIAFFARLAARRRASLFSQSNCERRDLLFTPPCTYGSGSEQSQFGDEVDDDTLSELRLRDFLSLSARPHN